MAANGWMSSEWSALSSEVDDLGSAEDLRPPADVVAASLLEGARIVVVGDHPVITDGLVQQLRAHGAFVGVTDGRGRGLEHLGFLDAQVVLFDPSRAAEDRVARALEAQARLRGAAMVRFSWDEVWPGGEPHSMRLAMTIAKEIHLDRELRWMAQARSSFPVPFARLGPARTLQALAGACGSVLRLVVAEDDVRATVEIGGDLIISATWYQGQSAAPRYVGVRALGALLGMRGGRAHVERHELARVMTIMAPVSLALLGADRERHSTTSDLRALAPRHGESVDRVALSAMLAGESEPGEADAKHDPTDASTSSEDDVWEDVTTKQGLTLLPPEAFPEDPPTEDLLPTGRRRPAGEDAGLVIPRPKPRRARLAASPSGELLTAKEEASSARRALGPNEGAASTAEDVTLLPTQPTLEQVELAEGSARGAKARRAEGRAREAKARRAEWRARETKARVEGRRRAEARKAQPPPTEAEARRAQPTEPVENASLARAKPTVVELAEAARGLSPVDELLEGPARGARLAAMKRTVEAPWANGAQVKLPKPPRPSAPHAKPAWMKDLGDVPMSPLAPRVLVAAAGYRPPKPQAAVAPPRPTSPPPRAATPQGWMPFALAAFATAALGWLLANALDVDGAAAAATSVTTRVESASEARHTEPTEAPSPPDRRARSRTARTSEQPPSSERNPPRRSERAPSPQEARTPSAAPQQRSDAPNLATADVSERSTPPRRAPDRFFPTDISGADYDRERSDRLYRRAREVSGAERRQLLWEAANAHQRNPHVAVELAHLAFEDGDLELAEAWARKAVSIRRRRDEYRVLLGRILRERAE